MNLVQKSPEVYLAAGPISVIGRPEISILEKALATSLRGRVRINVHPGSDDPLHEMFIAISARSYIHPHKHKTKSEAFHLVYGAVDVVVLDDAGEIMQLVPLAADGTSGSFYYRMSAPLFHTLMIKSDFLVVHEITNGPFQQGETVMADFAPLEANRNAAAAYQSELAQRVAAFRAAS
jgi:cupin fold WbuC family metalloprotein